MENTDEGDDKLSSDEEESYEAMRQKRIERNNQAWSEIKV